MRRPILVVLLALTLASCGSDDVATPATVTQVVTALAQPAAAAPVSSMPNEGPTRSFETGDTLPQQSLQVASDGCGVIRSEFSGGPPHGLQWTVTDAEGFDVLGRNALGETRYRFFRPGTYTVVLKAWGGESYVPVSNAVSIAC